MNSEVQLRRKLQIEVLLTETFQPIHLEVIDESHLHHGHAGAKTGKGHFAVVIQSDAFKTGTLVSHHRQIYQALATLMQTDIHALSIKILAP